MRMHGWCERCHRIRMVRVIRWFGKSPTGICAECEEREK